MLRHVLVMKTKQQRRRTVEVPGCAETVPSQFLRGSVPLGSVHSQVACQVWRKQHLPSKIIVQACNIEPYVTERQT